MGTTQVKRQSQPVYDVVDDDEMYDTRTPSSTRRYKPSQPVARQRPAQVAQPVQEDEFDEPLTQNVIPVQRRRSGDEPTTQGATLIQRRRSSLAPKNTNGIASNAVAPKLTEPIQEQRRFPWTGVLVGMVITVLLVMTLTALGTWWRGYQDDLHYGRPRTFQMDAVVGHEDSPANPTHFIFLNLHRHVEIIEIPGGDAAHTRIYSGPVLFGDGQDLVPVTGEVRDVNGDGKLDLIVHIQDQQIVFLNDGTSFKPQ
jgi:hypothetical protein